MKRIIICLSAITVSLQGCGVYQKYSKTTEVDKNLFGGEYVNEYAAVDTASSIATLSWREFFTDPQLRNLIDSALVRNTDLRTAGLRVEQASAALSAARLAYLPSVSLTGDGTLSRWDGQDSKTYNLGGNASWELDIFGRVRNAKMEARSALESSQAYEQAVKTSLIATVASTYYSLLMLDERLAINERTLDNWTKTVSAMSSLMKAGYYNKTAVLQAEANRMALEQAVLSVRQSIAETEKSMCSLLAITPDSIERGTLDGQSFPQELSVGLPASLLANRPDVRQAEASLAKAFYAVGSARSAFYPSLTLSGSAGWTNNGGGVEVNPGNLLMNMAGSLVQPLFNRGTNVANLKIAKAEQEAALLAFNQKLLDAGAEVNNSLTSWQTARKRLEIGEKRIESLQETVQKTERLMKHSSVNYLEVLTAQQSLLAAEEEQAQDRFEEIRSVISLYQALGGGWR